MSLDEAIQRTLMAYDKERLHPAPAEVVAQNIGYKGANSGTALQALASLRYYGLLDRPRDGVLAVSKDVESYKFAPDERIRREILIRFLKSPPLYAELLEKYSAGLPSDANLKHELITQKGFTPAAADIVLRAFQRSVVFAEYFRDDNTARDQIEHEVLPKGPTEAYPRVDDRAISRERNAPVTDDEGDLDRIPVRLPGNRRAWLVIPMPFFNSDKARLKAQIDLLLTEDEDGPNASA